MLAQVLIAEADAFVAMWKDEKLPDGRDRIVRHGHGPLSRDPDRGRSCGGPSRQDARPRRRARGGEDPFFLGDPAEMGAADEEPGRAACQFSTCVAVSTGDFQEALGALLGQEAPNLSPAVISRLTAEWQADYEVWQKRDLSARRYVYVWADAVYLQARMEDSAECMLVLIGATPEGKKELVGFQTGVRESAQSWRELLYRYQTACARDRATSVGRMRPVLLGDRRGLSEHQASALLCSQYRQRAEQGCPLCPGQHEDRPSSDLWRANPRRRRARDRRVRRKIRL